MKTPHITNSKKDWAFTDYIHRNLAIPLIYDPLGWKQIKLTEEYAKRIDMYKGIDYVFEHEGVLKTVQERFRDIKYKNFNDFTIRYRRDNNKYKERHKSEYYKIKAEYFTYGISNCHKTKALNHCSDFIKFALINLKEVYEKINTGYIVIEDNGKNKSYIKNGKLICPVKYNKDGSSSFIPLDIPYLVHLWGKKITITQKGFLK